MRFLTVLMLLSISFHTIAGNLTVINGCYKKIVMYHRHETPDAEWVIEKLKLRDGEQAEVDIMWGSDFYYWATTPTGSRIWEGEYNFRHRTTNFPMRKVENPAGGTIRLTCN